MTIKKFRELKKRQKQVRRQTIVDIAEELLSQSGPEGVTIRKVAKAAGVSVGSIYVYFKNKEELFLCMLIGHLERLHSDFAKSLSKKDLSPVEILKAAANDYKKYYIECGKHINAAGYLFQERTSAGEINSELLEELQKTLGGISSMVEETLKRPEMAGLLKGLDPSRGAPVLWSIITGLAQLTLPSPRAQQAGFEFEQVLDDLVHLFTG